MSYNQQPTQPAMEYINNYDLMPEALQTYLMGLFPNYTIRIQVSGSLLRAAKQAPDVRGTNGYLGISLMMGFLTSDT